MKHDTQLVTRVSPLRLPPVTVVQGRLNPSMIEDDISFAQLWRVLQKRRWTIFASVGLMLALALAVSLFMTPKYEGVSVIEVNKENADMLGLDDMTGMMGGSDGLDYNVSLQTQADVLKSDTLAFQVAQQLGLEKRKEFALRPGWSNVEQVKAELQLPLEKAPLRQQRIRDAFEKNLTVKTVPGTREIRVRFLSPHPQVAADVVNTLVNDFMEQYFRTRYSATAQASDWLSKQLSDLKTQVEISQEKLNSYQKQAGILGTDETQNVVMAKLEELNQQLTAAEANRILKETVYQLTKTGNAELVSGMAGSNLIGAQGAAAGANSLALIQNLRAQEADLKVQYAQAATKYGSAYPKLIQMRNQLQELDGDVRTEIGKLAARAQNDYIAAKNAENMLRASFDKQKTEANRLSDSAIQYTIMKREVESGRQLYQDLLKKLKEAGVLAGLRSTNIVVVDPGRLGAKPVQPNFPLNMALGLGIGLLGGMVLAFVRDSIDNTVSTPAQAEEITALPSLGFVPMMGNGRRHLHLPIGKKVPLEYSILENPSSQLAEAFRALRTSLLLSNVDSPPKTILVTSALPQEGKSTTSMNLAIALVQQGARVLLIEGDLRRPTLHSRLNIGTPSLSGALASRNGDRPTITEHPNVPGLFFLPAGPKPPFPAEALASERMKELLNTWREEFDFVVIDSPPLLSVTDAVMLSRSADAVLLVVRSEQTTRQSLLRARDLLRRAQASLVGVLVNDVDVNSPDYYQNYGYYGSKYGKEYYDGNN